MNLTIIAAVCLAISVASCSNRDAPEVAKGEAVVISAAASTKDMLQSLVEKHSKTANVRINAGPSSGLATQILEGAPSDLFLSASQEWADEVQKADLTVESTKLLTNRLSIVVPTGNPSNVHTPNDLAAESIAKIAMAGESVPAGKYGNQALEKLGLLTKLVEHGKIVRGQDVRSALAYVERGEADAGIVYSTDAKVTKGVESVYEFDPSLHEEIVYVLVLLKSGSEKQGARDLYRLMQSPEADTVYSQTGFERIK